MTDVATDVVTLRSETGVVEPLVPQVVSTGSQSTVLRWRGLASVSYALARDVLGSICRGCVGLSACDAFHRPFHTCWTFDDGCLWHGRAPWLSHGTPVVGAAAVVGWQTSAVWFAGTAGYRSGTGVRVGRLQVGPSLTWSTAAAYMLDSRWRMGLELYGAQQLSTNTVRGGGPAEGLVSAAFQLPWVSLHAGAGTGFGGGLGVPRWRAVFGLTVGPPGEGAS